MRTEEEILKDFEKIGYKKNEDKSEERFIILDKEEENFILRIRINGFIGYCKYEITKLDCTERTIYIRTHEHELIHELFERWSADLFKR